MLPGKIRKRIRLRNHNYAGMAAAARFAVAFRRSGSILAYYAGGYCEQARLFCDNIPLQRPACERDARMQ